MADNPYKHEGYDVIPLTDRNNQNALVGWFVYLLQKSFRTKEEANAAIDARVAELIQELKDRM